LTITALVNLAFTAHGLERQRRRGITDDQLELTLRYGLRLHVTGVILYYLRRRDVPWWIGTDYAAKVHGTVAVVSRDGALVTTYRNPKILHRLKKRPRWDRRRTVDLQS
jgi:hypothetical protein